MLVNKKQSLKQYARWKVKKKIIFLTYIVSEQIVGF